MGVSSLICELDVGQGSGNMKRKRQNFSEGLQWRWEADRPTNHFNIHDLDNLFLLDKNYVEQQSR